MKKVTNNGFAYFINYCSRLKRNTYKGYKIYTGVLEPVKITKSTNKTKRICYFFQSNQKVQVELHTKHATLEGNFKKYINL